jgi:hypothetical protein
MARPFARYAISSATEEGAQSIAYGSAESLDLELSASGDRASAVASIEAALLSGAAAETAWAASAAGLADEDLLLAPVYSAASPPPDRLFEARVRLLYAKLDLDLLSLTAGRQVLNYARGSLWSPTDLFTELDLTGLSPVRRGTDALRLVFPLGATGAFDLAAAPEALFSSGRYAARLSGFAASIGEGVDGALIACRDGGRDSAASGASWRVGADLKTDLVVGLDAEALYTLADTGVAWLAAAGGADYSIGRLDLSAEYYYNGGGSEADSSAPGAHNAYGAVSWRATDFVRIVGSCIAGFSAKSLVSTLIASMDAAQNATISAYAKLSCAGLGEASWTRTAEAGLELEVKF